MREDYESGGVGGILLGGDQTFQVEVKVYGRFQSLFGDDEGFQKVRQRSCRVYQYE